MNSPRVQVAVMARQPVAGAAKTRLIPALGAEGAAALALRLLGHALAQAAQASIGPLALHLTPDAPSPAMQALAAQHGAALQGQGDGDLGARMARALAAGLAHEHAALVMGTDAPALDAAALRRAAAALATHDAVLVPALDGGFVLLGLRRCQPGLLAGLRWSHDQVLRETLAHLTAHGFAAPLLLPPVADIDTADDLRQVPSGWLASRD